MLKQCITKIEKKHTLGLEENKGRKMFPEKKTSGKKGKLQFYICNKYSMK